MNRAAIRWVGPSAIAFAAAIGLWALLDAGPEASGSIDVPTPVEVEPAPMAVDAGPPATIDAGVAAPVVRALSRRRVAVRAAKGKVEVRRAGKKAWTRLATGNALAASDTIRTGKNASVELLAGKHLVRVLPGTDVTVDELTADLTKFLLGAGMVEAESVGAAQRTLEIGAKGSDAQVQLQRGKARVSSNGEGTVAVGVIEGEARVRAAGKEIVLRKGQRSLIQRNQGPSAARPLATSLLMKVAWPEKTATNKRVITVTGRTEAGALVFAYGRKIRVSGDGTFTASIPLREGANRVRMRASDVSGNVSPADSPEIVVNTRGAKSQFETDGLWKAPAR